MKGGEGCLSLCRCGLGEEVSRGRGGGRGGKGLVAQKSVGGHSGACA